MEVKRFEGITKKFNSLEKKNIENETEIKTIDKRLKEEFDCNSIENAATLLDELKTKNEKDNKRLDLLTEEIEKITDWDEIEEYG